METTNTEKPAAQQCGAVQIPMSPQRVAALVEWAKDVQDFLGRLPMESSDIPALEKTAGLLRRYYDIATMGFREKPRPDPLGGALNSGDGVYRP